MTKTPTDDPFGGKRNTSTNPNKEQVFTSIDRQTQKLLDDIKKYNGQLQKIIESYRNIDVNNDKFYKEMRETIANNQKRIAELKEEKKNLKKGDPHADIDKELKELRNNNAELSSRSEKRKAEYIKEQQKVLRDEYKNLNAKRNITKGKVADRTEDDLARRSSKAYAAMFRGQFKDGQIPKNVLVGAAAMQASDKFIRKIVQAFAPLFNKLGKATNQLGRTIMLKGLSDFAGGHRLQGFGEMLAGLITYLVPAIMTTLGTFGGALLKDALANKEAGFGKWVADLFKTGKGAPSLGAKLGPVWGVLGKVVFFLGAIYSIFDGVADIFSKTADGLTKVFSVIQVIAGIAMLVAGGIALITGGPIAAGIATVAAVIAGIIAIVKGIYKALPWTKGKKNTNADGSSAKPPIGTKTLDSLDFQQDTAFGSKLAAKAKEVAETKDTMGQCLAGVAEAVEAVDPSINLRGIPHAYQAANVLAQSKRFQEIAINPADAAKLPAGAIAIWGQGTTESGHASVASGTGLEYSDHVQKQRTSVKRRDGLEYGGLRVFVPVDPDKPVMKAITKKYDITDNASNVQEISQDIQKAKEREAEAWKFINNRQKPPAAYTPVPAKEEGMSETITGNKCLTGEMYTCAQ